MDTSRPLSRRTLLAAGTSTVLAASTMGRATAATRLSRSTIAARQKFFGSANVNASSGAVRRDRVILSWFGVTNFAMAIGGRVVLLDAWVPRGPNSAVVPTSPSELAALRPSHIFIGHGHFDHAADAATIAASSGAVVVGSVAHCDQISRQAGRPISTRPLPVVSEGDQAALRLDARTHVTAIGHPHSQVQLPDGKESPLLLLPDLTPALTHPTSPKDLAHFLSHQGDQEGGTVLYRFAIGKFSLLWNDSAGPLRDFPDVADRLRRLPRPSLQVGAIQGFGQYTNGLRDPLDYVRAVRPRVFVPSHHDNWATPLSTPAAGYERPLREGLSKIPSRLRPTLRFIADPTDYIRPSRLTFAV